MTESPLVYTVTWSMSFDEDELMALDDDGSALSLPRRAALVAAGWLEDAMKNDGGANILVVRDENDEHLGTFDEFGGGEELRR